MNSTETGTTPHHGPYDSSRPHAVIDWFCADGAQGARFHTNLTAPEQLIPVLTDYLASCEARTVRPTVADFCDFCEQGSGAVQSGQPGHPVSSVASSYPIDSTVTYHYLLGEFHDYTAQPVGPEIWGTARVELQLVVQQRAQDARPGWPRTFAPFRPVLLVDRLSALAAVRTADDAVAAVNRAVAALDRNARTGELLVEQLERSLRGLISGRDAD